MTNKGERNRIEKKIYKRRLKNLGLTGDHFCYKSQGKPCSCYLCSPEKYDRHEKHKNKLIEDELDLELNTEETIQNQVDEEIENELKDITDTIKKHKENGDI